MLHVSSSDLDKAANIGIQDDAKKDLVELREFVKQFDGVVSKPNRTKLPVLYVQIIDRLFIIVILAPFRLTTLSLILRITRTSVRFWRITRQSGRLICLLSDRVTTKG